MPYNPNCPECTLRRHQDQAAGNYPDGKLNDQDEGELALAITTEGGNVVLNFGKATAWVGLPPQQAGELGLLLMKHAARLTGQPLTLKL